MQLDKRWLPKLKLADGIGVRSVVKQANAIILFATGIAASRMFEATLIPHFYPGPSSSQGSTRSTGQSAQ